MSKNKKSKKSQLPISRSFLKKTIFTLAGVLFLQLLLAVVYLTAFHNPSAHDIPVGIVTSDSAVGTSFKDAGKENFKVKEFTSLDEAKTELLNGNLYAVYAPKPLESSAIIASALDKKVTDVSLQLVKTFDASYQQKVAASYAQKGLTANTKEIAVRDEVPLQSADPNGTGIFYLAFSFVFGGYLAAVAVNILRGNSKFSHKLALIRSAGFAGVSFVGSLAVTLFAVFGVSILPDMAFWATWGIGFLTMFGVVLMSSALISLLGTLGTGLVIILFVILGTPASGGPLSLLLTSNGPWVWLSGVLPTGQSMEAIRQAAYFNGSAVWSHLWILLVYIVVGFAILVAYGVRHSSFESLEKNTEDS